MSADADYDEIEIGRFDEAEYEIANRRFEAFLRRERDEQELLEREFAKELERLLKIIRKNRTDPAADPPGWPDL
jgi:hypothetical protein